MAGAMSQGGDSGSAVIDEENNLGPSSLVAIQPLSSTEYRMFSAGYYPSVKKTGNWKSKRGQTEIEQNGWKWRSILHRIGKEGSSYAIVISYSTNETYIRTNIPAQVEGIPIIFTYSGEITIHW